MAAKHMAPQGTTPTSEKYERLHNRHLSSEPTPQADQPQPSAPQADSFRADSFQTDSPQSDTHQPSAPQPDSPQQEKPRKKHPVRTALIVIAIAIVALALAYAFVPSAQAAVNNLLQPQAQEETSTEDATTDDAAEAAATTTPEDVEPSADEQDAAAKDEATTEEPAADPEPVDDASPYDATAAATTTTTASGITVTAAPGFESTTTAAALETALGNLTGQGHSVSFVMYDLATGKGVSYNADAPMYPASCIKAAYCTWILESTGGNVSGSTSSTIENCLVNSSNEAFHTLIDAYGLRSYAAWLAQLAPETSSQAGTYYYPNISATGFANVWKEIYRYAAAGEGGSAFLAQCLAATNHSPMGGLLRSRYTVWSKPGWYPADGSGLEATNDAGIVFSDCGDYVYAIETNVPDDFSTVFPLVDALNATHGKICGGHSALYLNSSTAVSGDAE